MNERRHQQDSRRRNSARLPLAPSPLCVTDPRKKVGASTYSSSGPTMKRCLTSNEVSRWKSRWLASPPAATFARS
jgi:hypothetical protein